MNHLIYYKKTINIFYGPYNDISIIHYMIIHAININIHHTILWTIISIIQYISSYYDGPCFTISWIILLIFKILYISIIQYISSYYNGPYFTIFPYFMDHLINIHNIDMKMNIHHTILWTIISYNIHHNIHHTIYISWTIR